MKRFLSLAIIALSPQFAAAAKPISIFSDFEGGALGKIERVSETHFRCGVKGESDQDGRNRQANWWLMFRQHSWEAGSSWAGQSALRFLLSADPVAAEMRRTAIFKIFPCGDPDGVARGGVRFNANGFDLNRNWDAVDETKMPEIAAQRKAVLDWVDAGRRVDLFLTLHNTDFGIPRRTAGC